MTEKATILTNLWSAWPVDVLADFCVTLVSWYRGAGYMYTEDDDDEFQELTPFDYFEQAHPTEFAQYRRVLNKSIARKDVPIYRTILFEQASELIDMIDAYTADILADSLREQNTLFGRRPSDIDFADFSANLTVRRYSSWTLSPWAAYQLSFEGGMYQIGEGSVLVRAAPEDVEIAHTVFAGQLFEKFMLKRPELAAFCSYFMEPWIWQKEYVVYSPKQEVKVDGILVASMENYEYYNRIMELAEEDEEE